MVAIVNIDSRCDLSIDACPTNQPNKSKLALQKWLIYHYLKQLYMYNKTTHFSNKGGCGECCTCIDVF